MTTAHPWLRSEVTVPEPDAVCEACDRPLFADAGDEWEEQLAQDADGVTTFTICQQCIEAADEEAWT